MELIAMVAALALIEYLIFSYRTGQARGKYSVEAPAVTGHPIFERYYRVQMNTLEQLIVFLPGLFLFSGRACEGSGRCPFTLCPERLLNLRMPSAIEAVAGHQGDPGGGQHGDSGTGGVAQRVDRGLGYGPRLRL